MRHAKWASRDARALFSGGLDNGEHRMDLRRLVRQRSAAAQRLPSTCATLCASPLPPPLLACCVAARLSWSTLRDRTAGRSRPLQAAAGCCRPQQAAAGRSRLLQVRCRLLQATARFPSDMQAQRLLRVRDTEAGRWYRWAQFDHTNRTGALAAKRPPLPLSSTCEHRVALSLSGFGYSSRLRHDQHGRSRHQQDHAGRGQSWPPTARGALLLLAHGRLPGCSAELRPLGPRGPLNAAAEDPDLSLPRRGPLSSATEPL